LDKEKGEVSDTRDLAVLHAFTAALARTVKASRIYLPNNEVLLTFKSELKDHLKEVLEENGELELDVQPGEIRFQGSTVYKDIGANKGFASKIYNDGMRRLILRQGMTESELDDLLDVMVTDYEEEVNLEDDLVTKVWEKDFTNVEITIAEEILRSTDIWDPNAVDPEKVASYLEYAGPGNEDEENAMVQEFSFLGTVGPSSYQHTVTMEELKELEAEVQKARLSNPLLAFNELVFELLDSDRNPEELRILLETASRNLYHMASQGLLEASMETVERLKSVGLLLSIPDMDVDKEVENILARASLQAAQRALDYAEQAQDVRTDELISFLKILDGTVIDLLFERLESTKRPHVRSALVEALTHHCGNRHDILRTKLLESSNPALLRDLINIIAAIGDSGFLKYLPKFLRHHEVQVRAEAVRALGRFKSAEVVPLLLMALKDPQERIRLTSTRQLAYSEDIRAFEGIKERIESQDFNKFSMTEQRYLFTALALLGKESVVSYLSRMLDDTSGFGGHSSPKGINAVHALATIGTPSALDVLKKGATKGPRKIKEACNRALSKLANKRSG